MMVSRDSSAKRPLRCSGEPEGGSWFAVNKALADIVRERDPYLEHRGRGPGGRDNPTCMKDGSADLGTSINFLERAAARGDDLYPGKAQPQATQP